MKNKIIQALKEGKTYADISLELFGTTKTAGVITYIQKNNIHPWLYNDLYLFMNKEWLTEQFKIYSSPNQISQAYDMPRTSVTRYAQRFGLYNPKFERQAKNEINVHYFDHINTAAKAYFLGLIMTDGNIYKFKDQDRYQFELKLQARDKHILETLANEISFSVDKIHKHDCVRNETITQAYSLRSFNKDFCLSLIKLGVIQRKTKYETFPKQIPPEFTRDFVRGIWDGDGSILPMTKTVQFCSCSLQLLTSVQEWLTAHNIQWTCRHDKTVDVIYVRRKSLPVFLPLVYYPECICLERKRQASIEIQSSCLGINRENEGELLETLQKETTSSQAPVRNESN